MISSYFWPFHCQVKLILGKSLKQGDEIYGKQKYVEKIQLSIGEQTKRPVIHFRPSLSATLYVVVRHF